MNRLCFWGGMACTSLLSIFYFGPFFLSLKTIVTDDFSYPYAKRWFGEFQKFFGSWNESNLLGVPEQVLLNVPTILQFLLPPTISTNLVFIFAIILTFACGYFLFRTLKLSPLTASFTSLILTFSPLHFTLISTGHLGKLYLLPFIMLAIAFSNQLLLEDFKKHSKKKKWVLSILLGTSLSLSFISSAYQTAMYFYIFFIAYIFFLLIVSTKKDTQQLKNEKKLTSPKHTPIKQLKEKIFWLAVASVLSTTLALHPIYQAYQLLDTSKIDKELLQTPYTDEDFGPVEKYNWATQWSFPPEEMIDFIVFGTMGYATYNQDSPYWGKIGRTPGYTGEKHSLKTTPFPNYSGTSHYLGLFSLFFFFVALVNVFRPATYSLSNVRSSFTSFWLMVAGVSLALSFGRYAPFYQWLYILPYMDVVRNPNKFLQVFHLAYFLVVCSGVEYIFRLLTMPNEQKSVSKENEKYSLPSKNPKTSKDILVSVNANTSPINSGKFGDEKKSNASSHGDHSDDHTTPYSLPNIKREIFILTSSFAFLVLATQVLYFFYLDAISIELIGELSKLFNPNIASLALEQSFAHQKFAIGNLLIMLIFSTIAINLSISKNKSKIVFGLLILLACTLWDSSRANTKYLKFEDLKETLRETPLSDIIDEFSEVEGERTFLVNQDGMSQLFLWKHALYTGHNFLNARVTRTPPIAFSHFIQSSGFNNFIGLRLASVEFYVDKNNFFHPFLSPVREIKSYFSPTSLFVYRLNGTLPKVYSPTQLLCVDSINSTYTRITNIHFDPNIQAVTTIGVLPKSILPHTRLEQEKCAYNPEDEKIRTSEINKMKGIRFNNTSSKDTTTPKSVVSQPKGENTSQQTSTVHQSQPNGQKSSLSNLKLGKNISFLPVDVKIKSLSEEKIVAHLTTKGQTNPDTGQNNQDLNQKILLVLANHYHPDWKAHAILDNQKKVLLEHFPVNHLFNGFIAPKNAKEVVIAFRPKLLAFFHLLTILNYLILAIAVIVYAKKMPSQLVMAK